jgi:hypothetical protein
MEHPEKALFDEVRGLRNNLEESKSRVEQIEKDYYDKVINYETRRVINERLDKKIEEFLTDTEQVTLIVNGKEYTYLKTFFTKNIFKVSFLSSNEAELDMSKQDFKAVIEILRTGFNYYSGGETNMSENLPRKLELKNPELHKDKGFVNVLKESFTPESFDLLTERYNLQYLYLGSNPNDLIESFKVEAEYKDERLVKYKLTETDSASELARRDHVGTPRALFIGTKGKIVIALKEKLRTNRIFIKPFCGDSAKWQPSNGKGTTVITFSNDGESWGNPKAVPTTYGTNSKDPSCISLDKMISFKYVCFSSDGSNTFSLSYFGFEK